MTMVMQVSHKVQPHYIYLYFDIKKKLWRQANNIIRNRGVTEAHYPVRNDIKFEHLHWTHHEVETDKQNSHCSPTSGRSENIVSLFRKEQVAVWMVMRTLLPWTSCPLKHNEENMSLVFTLDLCQLKLLK